MFRGLLLLLSAAAALSPGKHCFLQLVNRHRQHVNLAPCRRWGVCGLPSLAAFENKGLAFYACTQWSGGIRL